MEAFLKKIPLYEYYQTVCNLSLQES